MNVVLAGDGPIAAHAYRAIGALERVSVAAVLCGQDGDLPALVEHDGIPSAAVSTLRYPMVAAPFLRAAKCHLLVLANVPVIVPPSVLDEPYHGALCFHPSLLPRHRGRDAVKWTLVMGDTETGVTIFRPDGGIDTGPIVEARSCPVPPGISAGRFYYGTLVPMGVDALCAAVAAVRDGTATFTPQDEALATYEPPYEDAA